MRWPDSRQPLKQFEQAVSRPGAAFRRGEPGIWRECFSADMMSNICNQKATAVQNTGHAFLRGISRRWRERPAALACAQRLAVALHRFRASNGLAVTFERTGIPTMSPDYSLTPLRLTLCAW